MMRKTRSIAIWVTVVAMIMLCLWLAYLRMRPPQLMARATRVGSLPGIDNIWRDYQWLSDTELITTQTLCDNSGATSTILVRVNTKMKTISYSALPGIPGTTGQESYVLSPNGKYMIVRDAQVTPNTTWLVDLNGTQHARLIKQHANSLFVWHDVRLVPPVPLYVDPLVVWNGDSNYWLEIGDREVITHVRSQLDHALKRPVAHTHRGLDPEDDIYQHFIPLAVFDSSNIRYTKQNEHVIAVQCPSFVNSPFAVIWDFDLNTTPVIKQTRVWQLPAGVITYDYTLSTDATRIVWLFTRDASESLPSWLTQRIPMLRSNRAGIQQELWTSRLDGGDMREIGYFPLKEQTPSDVTGLFWSRDDRKIYFIKGGTLWYVVL